MVVREQIFSECMHCSFTGCKGGWMTLNSLHFWPWQRRWSLCMCAVLVLILMSQMHLTSWLAAQLKPMFAAADQQAIVACWLPWSFWKPSIPCLFCAAVPLIAVSMSLSTKQKRLTIHDRLANAQTRSKHALHHRIDELGRGCFDRQSSLLENFPGTQKWPENYTW